LKEKIDKKKSKSQKNVNNQNQNKNNEDHIWKITNHNYGSNDKIGNKLKYYKRTKNKN